MTDPPANRVTQVTARAENGRLRAEIDFQYEPKEARKRWIDRRFLSADLLAWLDQAQDGTSLEIVVEIPPPGDGELRCSPAKPLGVHPTNPDPAVVERLERDRGAGFRNPYTFVPALDRGSLPAPFGDAAPPSHARYDPGTQWTGTLHVRLTTLTPLLLPDTGRAERKQPDGNGGGDSRQWPKRYDVRIGPDGRPVIHGASLKGALRSAYEMITASRLGVFRGHEEPLSYRRSASSGLRLTPARIEEAPDGTAQFRLCLGDSGWRDPRGYPKTMTAAWVPTYGRAGFPGVADYENLAPGLLGSLHGTDAVARLRLFRHARRNFTLWRATHVAPTREALQAYLSHHPPADGNQGNLELIANSDVRTESGWLSITGHSFTRKHDERLFVATPNDARRIVEPAHRQLWQSVLRGYADAALTHDPPDNRDRSRHVGYCQQLLPLPPGTLVYLEISGDDPVKDPIIGVHPVMVGRAVFRRAPTAGLPRSVLPARSRDELSAADRVFGWVSPGRDGQDQDEDSADREGGYRGRIAFGPVVCSSSDPAEWAQDHRPDGLALAPLSTPKPTQFRFYASADRGGAPFPAQAAKHDGYTATTGLRGRKAYWWPLVTDDYWNPGGPPLPGGRHREYLPPPGTKPSQKTIHQRWIRPGTVFEVDIRVDGLSRGELGALIWLLSLPEGHALRLGGGKPLGFGAVRAQLTGLDGTGQDSAATDGTDLGHAGASRTAIWTGSQLRGCWLQLRRPDPAPASQLRELAAEFAATAAADPVLGQAVDGFLAVSQGTTHPVHYPRSTRAPEAETYRWFVGNEEEESGGPRYGFSLPRFDDDSGGLLPYLAPQRNQG